MRREEAARRDVARGRQRGTFHRQRPGAARRWPVRSRSPAGLRGAPGKPPAPGALTPRSFSPSSSNSSEPKSDMPSPRSRSSPPPARLQSVGPRRPHRRVRRRHGDEVRPASPLARAPGSGPEGRGGASGRVRVLS